ncbi:hypothetical protein E2C01_102530 [Portunus trituberculatus]|uniref:Uncharacterized protein n=1 Tax=Portunus trituberculatus TaxID=210409 RepID=A0A5B7KIN9_PORTR|nr:hypothetical protein [Portunus trituberculatus]
MERLTDDIRREHQEVYQTLPMFIVLELWTLSDGTGLAREELFRVILSCLTTLAKRYSVNSP